MKYTKCKAKRKSRALRRGGIGGVAPDGQQQPLNTHGMDRGAQFLPETALPSRPEKQNLIIHGKGLNNPLSGYSPTLPELCVQPSFCYYFGNGLNNLHVINDKSLIYIVSTNHREPAGPTAPTMPARTRP